LSPEFTIERQYINFLIAGERDFASRIGVELLVDGSVARTSSATEARSDIALRWRTWDVGQWRGRRAQIRVHDNTANGSVAVDQFIASDRRRAVPSDAANLLHETHRPQFHFTARAGWMNDANGLLHYRGTWHLFHQHRPPGSPVTVWGHAVSTDLLHWQHRPVALPGEGESSIFSGSGLVDRENRSGLKQGDDDPLLLFYTLRPPGETTVIDGKGERATQCLAYSLDGGETFQRFADNPILRTPDFRDRDPRVFRHEPTSAWIMVLSLSRNNADRDRAAYGLFRSVDLRSWELVQEIGPGRWYWECPDMFELPIDGDPGRTKWLVVRGSGDYIVGSFDGRRFTPETDIIKSKWGGYYYGAQTFSDAPDGRRVQIGWMSTGKEAAPGTYPGMPFNQQMSIPREWTLRTTPDGPRVFCQPIRELEGLRAKTHNFDPRVLQPGQNALEGISHDLLDIEMVIDPPQTGQVVLNLRGEEIVYDMKEKRLKAFGGSAPLAPKEGKLVLRLVLDRTSIELFAGDGEVTHSGVFFPEPANRKFRLSVQGGPARVDRLVVYELKSVWPDLANDE
ncbi:MAG: glycoside hydrolase family 32 protein, partial [Planctomycetota bacterium]